ncbi:lipopolysaccharide assembly protein LapB [Alkalibacterium sp. 20]|uniref:tetratricopeptide repeat protein n=1 Tax=Alkalibacterium sp. 20 TaxID=1798803 RepID=UPI0009003902|nr:hypothetical protein [Alkalibacterium sp. 20]OJF91683.1 hypothetical protein AX762_10890 [Alkalibacterium sp. 20]
MKKIFVTLTTLTILLVSLVWLNSLENQKIENQEQKTLAIENYIEEAPEDLNAKKTLGMRYLAQNEYNKAQVILNDIYKQSTSNEEILHPLVVVELNLENYDRAIKLSEELLKFNNYNSVALFNLAQIHFLKDNEEQFLEYLNSSVDAYNFTKEGETEFDDFYNNANTISNEYKKLLSNGETDKANSLIESNELFFNVVREKAKGNIANQ